jgi:uncharacterized protein YsxB (DUF464 family)
MISVEIVEGDGTWQLTISGHADETVCAAVTAVEQSTAIWFDQLAGLVGPSQVQFTTRHERTNQ